MKKFYKANGLFLFYLVANKSENHWRKYPAKTQNGSPIITDLSKVLMSAFILKCHKILMMSLFYKTDEYTTKGPATNTWIKNPNIVVIKDN